MRVYFSQLFKEHRPPRRHPEAPDRLDYLLEGAREAGAEIVEPQAREDAWRLIELAHDKSYVELVRRLCREGEAFIDGDTYISEGTCDAAALAISAAAGAIDKRETALIATRPPGHHAGIAGRALSAPTQGFCIFNTAAVSALYAGEGVAIVDVDAHHGNGTQEILYERDILYISTHQHPATLYPGTGYPDEIGRGRGEGYNINIPLPPGTGDDVYAKVIDEIVVPILKQYGPRVVIVSLGWDAHRDDPLTDMNLSLNGYLYVLDALRRLQTQIVILLEGGYNRDVIKRGTRALVRMFDSGAFEPGEGRTETDPAALRRAGEILGEVRRAVSRYWKI